MKFLDVPWSLLKKIRKFFLKKLHKNEYSVQVKYNHKNTTISGIVQKRFTLIRSNKYRFAIKILLNNAVITTVNIVPGKKFSYSFDRHIFNFGAYDIAISVPNGNITRVCKFVQEANSKFTTHINEEKEREISIIIPVFNAAEDFRECIQRILKFTTLKCRLFIIDDYSSDPEVNDVLKTIQHYDNIYIFRNEKNCGFTRSVNRGLEASCPDDVVIVNSDARVTPNWLEGLVRAIDSGPKTATATPLSDNSGAFSVPVANTPNLLPPGVSEEEYALALQRRAHGFYPTVPTGNGFCMLIARQALDEVGLFDAEAFPCGYGEENDFCMRAESLGWRHVIDDKTIVFHANAKSFGAAKSSLVKKGRETVLTRYPQYPVRTKKFYERPIETVRFLAQQALNDCLHTKPKPSLLFVFAIKGGGTALSSHEMMRGLSAEWDVWFLSSRFGHMNLYRVEGDNHYHVASHILSEYVDTTTHQSAEYDRVFRHWMKVHKYSIVHIHHFAWQSLSLSKIAQECGASVIVSLRDYYSLCPSTVLLDGHSNFCSGKCHALKEHCKPLLCQPEMMPPLNLSFNTIWRGMFSDCFKFVDYFVVCSPFVKQRFSQHMPSVKTDKYIEIPHGRNFKFEYSSAQIPTHGQKLKILVPGNINISKGLNIILDISKEDKAGHLEFHILGKHEFDDDKSGIFFHGAYDRDSFPKIAAKINPHVGAIFSIWDETWCHTLTELWASGLPVMALNFDTVAARIRESGAGWVYDLGAAKSLYQNIIADGFNPHEMLKKKEAVKGWQETKGLAESSQLMFARYGRLYSVAINRKLRAQNAFTPTDNHNQYVKMADVVGVFNPTSSVHDIFGRLYAQTKALLKTSYHRSYTFCEMTWTQLCAAIRNQSIAISIIRLDTLDDRQCELLTSAEMEGKYILLYNGICNISHNIIAKIMSMARVIVIPHEYFYRDVSIYNTHIEVIHNIPNHDLWSGPVSTPAKKFNTIKLMLLNYADMSSLSKETVHLFDALSRQYPGFLVQCIGTPIRCAGSHRHWLKSYPLPSSRYDCKSTISFLRRIAKKSQAGIIIDNNLTASLARVDDFLSLGLPCILYSKIFTQNDMAYLTDYIDIAFNIDCCKALIQEKLDNKVWVNHNRNDAVRKYFKRFDPDITFMRLDSMINNYFNNK